MNHRPNHKAYHSMLWHKMAPKMYHRESLKALHCNTDVTGGNVGVTGSNTSVTSCNVEIEKELEKERELERENTFCSEPENPPSEPPLISLPLNDKTYHEVFCDDVDGWKELYPAVDIVQELRKMKGWLDSNPTKRKTRRGIRRFINSWLAREQDRRHDTEGGRTRSEEISIPKSKEEIESEIYKIVHNLISREALERYRDKIHELIRLCCPFEIFTQEQIDYMKREWKMEPLHKENSLIAPREDIYYFFDDKLGIIKDDETNNVP